MFLGSACRKELKGGYDGIQKWHTVIVLALVYNNKAIRDADLILGEFFTFPFLVLYKLPVFYSIIL